MCASFEALTVAHARELKSRRCSLTAKALGSVCISDEAPILRIQRSLLARGGLHASNLKRNSDAATCCVLRGFSWTFNH